MKQNNENPEKKQALTYQIPAAVVDSGALRAMLGSTLKVYNCLCRHRHFKRHTAWPSSKTIISETGVRRNVVFWSLRWLIAAGLIERRRGPKEMSFVNIYTIIMDPNIIIPSYPQKGYKKKREKDPKTGKFTEKRGGVSITDTTSLIHKKGTTSLIHEKGTRKKRKDIVSIEMGENASMSAKPVTSESQKGTGEKDFQREIKHLTKIIEKKKTKKTGFKPHERTNKMKEL